MKNRFLHIITVILLFLNVGCGMSGPVRTTDDTVKSTSLLLIEPIIDNAYSASDVILQPSRMIIDDISVEGWVMRTEEIFAFPLNLEEGARLSICIGVDTEVPVRNNDLELSISWRPESDGETTPDKQVIYQTTPVRTPEIMERWVRYDFVLDSYQPGEGELLFESAGMLSGDPGIAIMWGHPVVYYPERRSGRNIYLVGVDALRRDALGIYGGRSEVSPDIDNLSSDALVFENSFSQAPFTGPSFASMLTGKYPADIRPTLSRIQLPQNAETIAEMARANGYATCMVCGNPYLGRESSGFAQGFDEYWYELNATPGDTINKALELIESAPDQDLFVFIHVMDPHHPYDPPPEKIEELCVPGYTGRYQHEFTDQRLWHILDEPPSVSEINRVKSLYEAEVGDVDDAFKILYEHITDNPPDDELLILTADHGEEFYDHGQYGHGQSLYNELIHTPLIVWGLHSGSSGTTISNPVSNVDIVPTILDYMGTEIPEGLRGNPLQEIASGTVTENRMICGEGNLRLGNHQKYVIDWPYKCIMDYFTSDVHLYDLENDPNETMDLADINRDITQRLMIEATVSMVPLQDTFIIAFTGDPLQGPARFNGSIIIPDGYDYIMPSGLLESDLHTVEGNTIAFNIASATLPEAPIKALVIFLKPGSDTISLEVRADGYLPSDHFYPYSNSVSEPTGDATVSISELTWPNQMPIDATTRSASCYVLAIPGFPSEEPGEFEHSELDAVTLEQLRALGYVN